MSTGQFLSLPATATGLSIVSSATAWAFGTPVAVATLADDIKVFSFNFQNTDIPVVDVLQEILFEITIGGTTFLQVPFSMKADTLVGYDFSPPKSGSNNFYFPNPYFIPACSVVAIKVTDSIAAALTYNGVKILYDELSHPTTALNTPTDTEAISDTTPTLNFTGTDADAALALEYQVQVDAVNSFDGQNQPIQIGGAATDRASAWNAGGYTTLLVNGVAGSSGTITAISLMASFSNMTGIKVGTFYGSGTSWTNRAYATIGDVAANSQQTFTGLSIAVETGDIIGIFANAGSIIEQDVSANLLYFYGDAVALGGAHTYAASGSGTNTLSLGTISSLSPLISASSASDAGFTSGHPFASATPTDYTVQSALTAPDTYYWRVRAARTGSCLFGEWSDIHSFNVT